MKKHINPNCQCCSCKSKRGEYKKENHPSFIDGRSLQKYKCKDCNKEISVGTGVYGKGRCESCAMKELFKNSENHPSFKDGNSIFQHSCIDCGKEITFQAIRCGICEHKRRNYIGKNHPNYIDGRKAINHFCIENCGTKISYKTWKYGNKRCGSCARAGERHPQYIDGRSFELYPQEFNSKLKEQIRTRDNFECQNCGMTEEEHLIVIGTILNVHHIDYNKTNCKENNLITICKQCNTRANFNRDYWFAYYINKMEVLNER